MPGVRETGVTAAREALQLPRRLAIQLMAHAQRLAEGEVLRGTLVGSGPASLQFRAGDPPKDAPVWAWVCPQPPAGSPPLPAGLPRVLTIGLDTKGVLQLRCWEVEGTELRERDLRISG